MSGGVDITACESYRRTHLADCLVRSPDITRVRKRYIATIISPIGITQEQVMSVEEDTIKRDQLAPTLEPGCMQLHPGANATRRRLPSEAVHTNHRNFRSMEID